MSIIIGILELSLPENYNALLWLFHKLGYGQWSVCSIIRQKDRFEVFNTAVLKIGVNI